MCIHFYVKRILYLLYVVLYIIEVYMAKKVEIKESYKNHGQNVYLFLCEIL